MLLVNSTSQKDGLANFEIFVTLSGQIELFPPLKFYQVILDSLQNFFKVREAAVIEHLGALKFARVLVPSRRVREDEGLIFSQV